MRLSDVPGGTDAPVSDEGYLRALGERVREIRARRGMTRRILSRDSRVSERYIAQLESGLGNISILLLRQLAHALDTPLEALVLEGPEPPIELVHSIALLRRLQPPELSSARRLLAQAFGTKDADRRNRVALIGLRGAGKSTLGRLLAKHRGCPFIELDREIETEAGASLGAIFDLYGQPGFRRLERRCLERVVAANERLVLAPGGGIVSDPSTFERLLATCFTVWIKASAAEHMERVVAQGDTRPMAENEAMADLKRILRGRETLYAKADAVVDSSRRTVEESFGDLLSLLRNA